MFVLSFGQSEDTRVTYLEDDEAAILKRLMELWSELLHVPVRVRRSPEVGLTQESSTDCPPRERLRIGSTYLRVGAAQWAINRH